MINTFSDWTDDSAEQESESSAEAPADYISNSKTNATADELALAASRPGFLQVVQAGDNRDGGLRATPEVAAIQASLVSERVEKLESGASRSKNVTINMAGANIIPMEILDAARGHDVNVVLDMGEYTWTINGMDITDKASEINLAVDFASSAIPDILIEENFPGLLTTEMSLRHDGSLGFLATLTIAAPVTETGHYGNLFRYVNNRLVFNGSSPVTQDGALSLKLGYASDYVIAYSENARIDLLYD